MIKVKSRDIMAKDVRMILKLLSTNLLGHLRYIIYLHLTSELYPMTSYNFILFGEC